MRAPSILRRWASLSIWALFLLYLGLGAYGFARPLRAIGQPFGGFIWLREETHGFTVGFESGRGWGGRRAGLVLDDRIVLIDGRPIPLDGPPDVIGETYRGARLGQIIQYQIERNGEPGHLQIPVPVERFSWRHFVEAYVPFYVAALAFWGIGLFVYRVSPHEEVSTVFALFCLAVSGPLTFHNFSGLIHEFYWARTPLLLLYAPVWPLICALGFHFFGIFPTPQAWWPRLRPWVYGTALLIGGLYSSSFAGRSSVLLQDTMLLATTVFTIVASLWGAFTLARAYRSSTSPEVRQQVRICGIGFGIGLIVPFLSMSSYILFRPYPDVWWSPGELLDRRLFPDWLVPLPIQMLVVGTSLPISIAVAILRHRVFGAKPALVKAITGTAILGSLVAAYALTMGLVQALLARSGFALWAEKRLGASVEWTWISTVLAAVTTAILFPPLRARIQTSVTRLLYPYRVTPSDALVQLIEAVRPAERDARGGVETEITGAVADVLRDTLHLREVLLWFHVPALKRLQVVCRQDVQPDCLPLGEDALQCLREAQPPLEPASAPPPLAPLCAALSARDVHVCLPLVYERHELVALVTLGPRVDGVPFGPEDRQLLVHLAGYLLLLLKSERAIHDLRQSRERLSAAQESERRRIAQGLHDLTMQDLSYLGTVQLERCRRAVSQPVQAGELIEQAQVMVRKAAADLRGILADVSPDVIRSRGLRSALESLISSERQRPGARGVEIALEVSGYTPHLWPEEHELAVFRYVSEALRNAVLHAHARRIEVLLQLSAGALVATVRDDGQGFDVEGVAKALQGGHLGLRGMLDRIETVGGSLGIDSGPGRGTTLQAVVPRPK